MSKTAAERTRKRTARGVLESDHRWTCARLVVCVRLQSARCGVFVVRIFRLVLAVIPCGVIGQDLSRFVRQWTVVS